MLGADITYDEDDGRLAALLAGLRHLCSAPQQGGACQQDEEEKQQPVGQQQQKGGGQEQEGEEDGEEEQDAQQQEQEQQPPSPLPPPHCTRVLLAHTQRDAHGDADGGCCVRLVKKLVEAGSPAGGDKGPRYAL